MNEHLIIKDDKTLGLALKGNQSLTGCDVSDANLNLLFDPRV
jgi:hypothetical protein